MAITLNGTTGIASTGAYSSDGISFADNTPADTLVTTTGGNVGIGTATPVSNSGYGGLTLNGTSGSLFSLMTNGSESGRIASLGDETSVQCKASTGYINFVQGVSGGTVRGRFDSAGNFQYNSGYGSVATAYGCRAWVNFNGTGTVAIRSSGNVSSVSDDGTGTYTINFTNAMPDANYNVISNGPPNSTTVVGGLGFVVRNSSPSGSPSNKTTTQVQMMYAGTGSLVDASELYASVFR